MTRKVVSQLAARARARERLHERYAREESDDPVVAKQAADLAGERQRRQEQRRERRRRSADPAGWLERAAAQVFARLDGRRAKPGPDAEAAFVVALRELVAEPEGARFVAQCLGLDPVEVRRLVGPIDVS